MSDYYNEAGEPLMDGASMRLEAYYDAMDDHYDPDDYLRGYDDEPDEQDPATCEHGNGSYPEGAGFECDDCGETFLGPRMIYVTTEGWSAGLEWDTFHSGTR